MGYYDNLAYFEQLKEMHIQVLSVASQAPNTPSMQSTTTKATNVNLCSIAKNKVKNEQDLEFCDDIKISKTCFHKQLVVHKIKFQLTPKVLNLQFFFQSIHFTTIILDCAATRFAWVVVFFSLKANTSTLATLSSRFSNSLRLHTQAIFASRLGFAKTSIVSFLDPLISPCPLAKEHSPSLDIDT
jgi:hypothetical protein